MSQDSIADWQRIYDELTNPEKREEARQATERAARLADERADTGY